MRFRPTARSSDRYRRTRRSSERGREPSGDSAVRAVGEALQPDRGALGLDADHPAGEPARDLRGEVAPVDARELLETVGLPHTEADLVRPRAALDGTDHEVDGLAGRRCGRAELGLDGTDPQVCAHRL